MKHSDNLKGLSIAAIWLSIVGFLRFLLRRWWIILLIAVLGGVIGIVIAMRDKPEYQSNLTFALEEGESGLSGALSLAAELGFNFSGSKNLFQGDNILTLLTSRTIIERVLLSVDTVNGKSTTMANYYLSISSDPSKKKLEKLGLNEQRLANVSFAVGEKRETLSYLQDSVLFVTYESLIKSGDLQATRPEKKLNLYQLTFKSPEERFTKVFTDRLISEATNFYTDLRSRHSREVLEILEARVAQIRGNLNSAITSRASVQDANVNPAFQQAQAQIQKEQVDINVYGGAYAELYKNLEIARYQYLRNIPLLQIIDGADYPMKKIKKGKLITGLTFAFVFGFLMVAFFFLRYIFLTSIKPQIEREELPEVALSAR